MTQMINTQESIEVQECYHCGEAAGPTLVRDKEKVFCCTGCRMVYRLLKDNDLCNYYELNEKAGLTIRTKRQDQYAYLEDTKVQEALLDFRSEETSSVQFSLPQIHCSSCLWLLENLNRLNPGISHSTVNFPNKTVRIYFSEQKTGLRAIVELLDQLGYPPSIRFADLDKPGTTKSDKTLIYQLGLAGFAFGNIMLLSFPEYLGLDPEADHTFQKVFAYLNILLVIPVVFYSGKDYLWSAWQGLKQRHLNIDVPISIGILALFGRSLYEILWQAGAGYLDSLAGLLFFLLIGKWFQQKTFKGLSFERDYKSYFPIAVQVWEAGQWLSRTLDQLKEGDRILIRSGEIIPADARLLDAEAQIDYSFVSGEARAVRKSEGELLYAGGRQLGGAIELEVCRTVDNSYLTQLWNEEVFAKERSDEQATELANTIGKYFTGFILVLSALTLLYWLPRDVGLAFNAFTAVLIVACPCAVALAVPFIFGNMIRLLGRKQLYLKNVRTLEKLARIDHIVFDKTGTLTVNQTSEVHYSGEPLSEEEKGWVKSLVHQSGHPVSRQIFNHLEESNLHGVEDFEEVVGEGIQGRVQGQQLRLGAAHAIQEAKENTSGSHLMINEYYKGCFTVNGRYRESLKDVLAQLRAYRFSVLTGDHEQERPRLIQFFGKATSMLFNQRPKDKLRYIQQLQQQGESVMMVGDGLNDAGALQQSDVGIVVSDDSGNFTPASDAILDARSFPYLPLFIRIAKSSIRLVYMAYALALVYNIIGLSFAVRAALSPVVAAILMPLSSISIVLFGLAGSHFLAWLSGLTKVIEEDDKYHL